jgi:large conductance mechanosensitive channel
MFLTKPIAEFRDFIARGSVVDLAVGVIAGVAFGAVVQSVVTDLITPLIAAIGGKPDFSDIVVNIGEGEIRVGNFLNAVFGFLLTMAAVFFIIVKPLAIATEKFAEPAAEAPMRECTYCLSRIPGQATRCSHCCAEVVPTS